MWCSYRSHGAEEATVAEKNDEEGDAEMKDEHIDDKGGVVDLRLGGVVVNPTGTLHSLWDVPASTHIVIMFQSTQLHQVILRFSKNLSIAG